MKRFSTQSPARSPIRFGAGVIALAVAMSLAGCGHDELASKGPGFELVNPAQRHPILVSQQPSTLTLAVPAGSSGLSAKSRADLLDFAQRYRAGDAGDSRLVISAPSGGHNEVAAMQTVQQVRAMLSDNGFSDSSISVEAYGAEHRSEPPIKVSYLRYIAEAPECGSWPTNVAYEPNNRPMANIGCANQRNFAAMVANPADLLGPRSETARPGERRDVVWEKYQKGETTATAKNVDGSVSTKEK